MTVKIVKHTEGDTRTATKIPTITEFNEANESHYHDVNNVAKRFWEIATNQFSSHDYTKRFDPERSEFYRDLCSAIDGMLKFDKGTWYPKHCKLERHHLDVNVPLGVNMIDVLEMIFDRVAAGMARGGTIYPIKLPEDVLNQAIQNTVEILKDEIEVVDGEHDKS